MKNAVRALAALALVAVSVACIESARPRATLGDRLVESNNHAILRTALASAGLDGIVNGTEGPEQVTLFAPTDDAWEALPDTTRTAILNDRERLRQLLLHHMVEGRVVARELTDGTTLTTLAGDRITVSGGGLSARVDGAALLLADLDAANGVLHVVDGVLTPSTP